MGIEAHVWKARKWRLCAEHQGPPQHKSYLHRAIIPSTILMEGLSQNCWDAGNITWNKIRDILSFDGTYGLMGDIVNYVKLPHGGSRGCN